MDLVSSLYMLENRQNSIKHGTTKENMVAGTLSFPLNGVTDSWDDTRDPSEDYWSAI